MAGTRRGLRSNLHRLGVSDIVIRRILRHANPSTTTGYDLKSQAQDVLDTMAKLEKSVLPKQLSESDTKTRLRRAADLDSVSA